MLVVGEAVQKDGVEDIRKLYAFWPIILYI